MMKTVPLRDHEAVVDDGVLGCIKRHLTPDVDRKLRDNIANVLRDPTACYRPSDGLASFARKKKYVIIRPSLKPDEQAALAATYPEYDIQFRDCSYEAHAFAHASRLLETEVLLDMIDYRTNSRYHVGNKEFPLVCDIGGNWHTHAMRGRRNIHSCCPMLSYQDECRNANRLDAMMKLIAATPDLKRVEHYKNVLDGDAFYRCANLGQDCAVYARYCIMVHSAYDMSFRDIVDSMVIKKSRILVGTIAYHSSILFSREGVIPMLRMRFSRMCINGDDKILFTFDGDSSHGYSHSYISYLDFMTTNMCVSSDGSAIGIKEFKGDRNGIKFYQITLVPAVQGHKTPIVTRFECIPDAGDMVALQGWEPDVSQRFGYHAFKRILVLIPEHLYEKLSKYALRSSGEKFSVAELFHYACSVVTRIIINGASVAMDKGDKLHTEELYKACVIIYLMAYVTKFETGKVVQAAIDDFKVTRERRAKSWWKNFIINTFQAFDDFGRLTDPTVEDYQGMLNGGVPGVTSGVSWYERAKTYISKLAEVRSLMPVGIDKAFGRITIVEQLEFVRACKRAEQEVDSFVLDSDISRLRMVYNLTENELVNAVQGCLSKDVCTIPELNVDLIDACDFDVDVDVPGDGNCCYNALIMAHQRVSTPAEVKCKLLKSKHLKLFSPHLASVLKVEQPTIPDEWGDIEVVQCYALEEDVTICLHAVVGGKTSHIVLNKGKLTTIHVKHTGQHYMSVLHRDTVASLLDTKAGGAKDGVCTKLFRKLRKKLIAKNKVNKDVSYMHVKGLFMGDRLVRREVVKPGKDFSFWQKVKRLLLNETTGEILSDLRGYSKETLMALRGLFKEKTDYTDMVEEDKRAYVDLREQVTTILAEPVPRRRLYYNPSETRDAFINKMMMGRHSPSEADYASVVGDVVLESPGSTSECIGDTCLGSVLNVESTDAGLDDVVSAEVFGVEPSGNEGLVLESTLRLSVAEEVQSVEVIAGELVPALKVDSESMVETEDSIGYGELSFDSSAAPAEDASTDVLVNADPVSTVRVSGGKFMYTCSSLDQSDLVVHFIHDRTFKPDGKVWGYSGFAGAVMADCDSFVDINLAAKLAGRYYTVTYGKKYREVVNLICNKNNCFDVLERFIVEDTAYDGRVLDTVLLGSGLFGYPVADLPSCYAALAGRGKSFMVHVPDKSIYRALLPKCTFASECRVHGDDYQDVVEYATELDGINTVEGKFVKRKNEHVTLIEGCGDAMVATRDEFENAVTKNVARLRSFVRDADYVRNHYSLYELVRMRCSLDCECEMLCLRTGFDRENVPLRGGGALWLEGSDGVDKLVAVYYGCNEQATRSYYEVVCPGIPLYVPRECAYDVLYHDTEEAFVDGVATTSGTYFSVEVCGVPLRGAITSNNHVSREEQNGINGVAELFLEEGDVYTLDRVYYDDDNILRVDAQEFEVVSRGNRYYRCDSARCSELILCATSPVGRRGTLWKGSEVCALAVSDDLYVPLTGLVPGLKVDHMLLSLPETVAGSQYEPFVVDAESPPASVPLFEFAADVEGSRMASIYTLRQVKQFFAHGELLFDKVLIKFVDNLLGLALVGSVRDFVAVFGEFLADSRFSAKTFYIKVSFCDDLSPVLSYLSEQTEVMRLKCMRVVMSIDRSDVRSVLSVLPMVSQVTHELNMRWRNKYSDANLMTGEDTGNKYVNAIREQRKLWHVMISQYTDICKRVYDEYCGLGASFDQARSLCDSDLKVCIYDCDSGKMVYKYPFGNFVYRVTAYTHFYCNKGIVAISDHMVKAGSLDPYYVTKERFGKYIFFLEQLKMFCDMLLYDATSEFDIYDAIPGDIDIVEGVPGCGKTTYIIRNHEYGCDLVLTSTREGADDIKARVAKEYGVVKDSYEVKQHYRTIDSYLIHGTKGDFSRVYIDEALMQHPGKILMVAVKSRCKKIIILGDRKQIGYVNRGGLFQCSYDKYDWLASSEKLSITWRCPVDVAACLTCVYGPGGILSANPRTNTRALLRINGISDVPLIDGADYLTFTQSEKKSLALHMRRHKVCVSTVHEYQGKQNKRIVVVRLNTLMAEPIFNKHEYALVALSRHTEQMTYCVVNGIDDLLSKWVSQRFSDSQLRAAMYNFKGGYMPVFDEEVLVERAQEVIKPLYVASSDDAELSKVVLLNDCCNVRTPPSVFYNTDLNTFVAVEDAVVKRVAMHGGYQAVQTFIDDLLPGNGAVDTTHDAAIVAESDLNMELKNVVVTQDKIVQLRRKVTNIVAEDAGNVMPMKLLRGQLGFAIVLPDSRKEMYKKYKAEVLDVDKLVKYKCLDRVVRYDTLSRMLTAERVKSRFVLFATAEEAENHGFVPVASAVYRDKISPEINSVEARHIGLVRVRSLLELDRWLVGVLKKKKRYFHGKIYDAVYGVDRSEKHFLKPKLRTCMPRNREKTQIETLLALIKRNMNVPNNQGDIDSEELADMMVNAFDGYIGGDKRNLYASFADNTVHMNAESIGDWLKKNNLPKDTVDDNMIVTETCFSNYSYMIKEQVKPDTSLQAPYEYKALQTIAYHDKPRNALISPMICEIRKRLMAVLDERFMIFCDVSTEEFAKRMTKVLPPRVAAALEALEIDIAKFDKSQGLAALLFECKMFKKLGLSEAFVAFWYDIHAESLLRDKDSGVSARINYQRRSGDAATFLGNTMLTMAVIACLFDLEKILMGLFAGDDSLIWVSEPIMDMSELCNILFNLESKFFKFKHHYFCSRYVIPVENHWVVVPDLVKMCVKLGRSDVRDVVHLEEYRVSLMDLCRGFFEVGTYDYITDLVNERYKKSFSDISYVVAAILNLVYNPLNFQSLFTLSDADLYQVPYLGCKIIYSEAFEPVLDRDLGNWYNPCSKRRRTTLQRLADYKPGFGGPQYCLTLPNEELVLAPGVRNVIVDDPLKQVKIVKVINYHRFCNE